MDNNIDNDDKPISFERVNTTTKQNEVRFIPKKTADSPAKLTREQGSSVSKTNSLTSTSSILEAIPDGCHVADSDDTDDDKPLKFRCSLPSSTDQITNPINSSKLTNKYSDLGGCEPPDLRLTTNVNNNTYVSTVEKSLSSRVCRSVTEAQDKGSLQLNKIVNSQSKNSTVFQKSIPTTSIKNTFDSDDEKPLSDMIQQNGFSKCYSGKAVVPGKSSNKRPLGSINNIETSNKKMRISSSGRTKVKHEPTAKEEPEMQVDDNNDDDGHVPIGQRIKKSTPGNQSSTKKIVKKVVSSSSKKKIKKPIKAVKVSKFSKSPKMQPGSIEGQKWTSLEHNGVIFPPPYKPHGVKMLYNGQPIYLTPEQEEVATMFAVMKDTEYATKKIFIDNFMSDWRMLLGKNHVIKKFELCDFTPIYEWHLKEKEKKKQMSTEEKKALKEEKMKQEEKYMWAIVDGIKEKVGNFRVEPPGLFRGRGEHPKMGKLKKRIQPEDITINIGKNAPIPECPINGQRWKEIRHDNTVTWLAYWNDPINTKDIKYVFLAASSSLKGQSDKEKYEKARKLKDYIHHIRETYTRDFTSKDETKRQIAVATYLIDKLALRAGNEKDDDEADTVGCCTLKVENVTLVPPNKLQFDFLGKDSIRYFNTVEVELPAYKAIGGFRTAGGKKGGDDLFDKLDTSKLNAHLKELMPGLTAKVFRTYNASITLDEMLNKDTKDGSVLEKVAVYQSANKEVAIICNHQRSVSKSHDSQMMRLDQKIADLKAEQEEMKVELSRARKGKPPLKNTKRNLSSEVLQKKLVQINAKIEKMELDRKAKDELKAVALGTSKINYLDPRISVAWCKRHEVPIEKIFNKSLLAKFAWAMDVDPAFRF